MNNILRSITFFIISAVFILGFEWGVMDGFSNNDCKYKSILSRAVFTYWIGCELTKPRFKENNVK